MRKSIVLSMAALLAISTGINAQDDKKKVEGSGNMITRDVNVTSFNEINVSGVFNLVLSQGANEDVKIEADDNLQSFFEVKNEGSKLVISMKKENYYNSKKTIKVYVTFKSLKNMEFSTVGNISSNGNLNFDDLKIGNKSVGSVDLNLTARSIDMDNKSVGDVKFTGKADGLTLHNKSVGNFEAGNFIVQSMDIDNQGIGNAEVNAAKELKVKSSMLGNVKNKGAASVSKSARVI